MSIRCYSCEKIFDDVPTDTRACPACGDTSIPHDTSNDIQLTMNIQDIRILTMWSDNYARKEGLGLQLEPAIRRIRRQLPEQMPLTLGEEVQQIRDLGYNAELYVGEKKVYPHE